MSASKCMARRSGARGADERGATLVLALVFMVVVGLLASVLLTMASTGARSTRSYREQRVLRYNAEAAVNQAIKKLQAEPALEDDPNRCMNFPLQDANVHKAFSGYGPYLWVDCSPTPGSPLDDEWGRDVTITVDCPNADHDVPRGPITCGDGSVDFPHVPGRVLAVVRVRFEPDYEVDGAPPTIPKILSWDTTSYA